MTMKHAHLRNQRGVVPITTLLILVVMLIGAVALVRSFDTSMVTAGNLSFKRDLAQQSELAVETILRDFRTAGPLATRAARCGRPSAQLQRAGAGGQRARHSAGAAERPGDADADRSADQPGYRNGQRDRCRPRHPPALRGRPPVQRARRRFDARRRTLHPGPRRAPRGGSYSQSQRAPSRSAVTGGSGAGLAGAAPQYVVYRVSIRAFGPRGTESFFQTTYGCCDD